MSIVKITSQIFTQEQLASLLAPPWHQCKTFWDRIKNYIKNLKDYTMFYHYNKHLCIIGGYNTLMEFRYRKMLCSNGLSLDVTEKFRIIDNPNNALFEKYTYYKLEVDNRIILQSLVFHSNQTDPIKKNIEDLFLQYRKERINLRSAAYDNPNKIESDNFIKEKLEKKFGTSKAPWDIINDTLNKNDFAYRVKEPKDDYYELSFEGRIKWYHELSHGENAIFHLICSAYSGGNQTGFTALDLNLDEYLNLLCSTENISKYISQKEILIVKNSGDVWIKA
jgi:hypothetical protein